MALYFFHITHPTSEPDTEGTELPDIYAAKAAAVKLCGELIREIDGTFWAAPLWEMQVANHEQRRLFTLTFSAEDQDSTV